MFRRNQHRHKRNAPTTSSFGRLPTFGVQSGNASVANSTTSSAARKLNPGRRYTGICPSCFVCVWQIHTRQGGPIFYADTPTLLQRFPKSFIEVVDQDTFLLDQFDLNPAAVSRALARQVSRYRRQPRTVDDLLIALGTAGNGCPNFAKSCHTDGPL
jgi:hypothetical protein